MQTLSIKNSNKHIFIYYFYFNREARIKEIYLTNFTRNHHQVK